MARPSETVLVTGSCGFLGLHMCRILLQKGYSVRGFDLRSTPAVAALPQGFTQVTGDLTREEDVRSAVEGCQAIIHTASPHIAAPAHILHKVNVDGSRILAEAATAAGVRALVYTSSASVIFDGTDTVNADESWPLITSGSTLDAYTASKAKAEQTILAADSATGVRTCAIRPSGIFGPEDATALPRVLEACRTGKFKYIIGDGENRFDFTYVKNVVHAHVLALEALLHKDAAGVAGKAFLITNDEPVKMWDHNINIATGLGYKRPTLHLPVGLVYWAMYIFGLICTVVNAITGKSLKPSIAPHEVRYLGTNRTFNISNAKQYLGYKPLYTMRQGWDETIAWCKEQGFEAGADAKKTK